MKLSNNPVQWTKAKALVMTNKAFYSFSKKHDMQVHRAPNKPTTTAYKQKQYIYILSYVSPPIWKLYPCGDIIFKLYKPAFHGRDTPIQFGLHDRVTPVSVLTLKPLLGVIEVLPLKPWVSPKLSVCI